MSTGVLRHRYCSLLIGQSVTRSVGLLVGQFVYCPVGLSFILSIVQLVYRSVGLSFNWSIVQLVYRSVDQSFSWFIIQLVYRSFGLLVGSSFIAPFLGQPAASMERKWDCDGRKIAP